MTASQSTLDRWPQALSVHWETHRLHVAATLRHQEPIPGEAVTMAVSRDGVMAPMKDGERHAKRTPAVAAGKTPPGPPGPPGGGGGSAAYSDPAGHRRRPPRLGRMPGAAETSRTGPPA